MVAEFGALTGFRSVVEVVLQHAVMFFGHCCQSEGTIAPPITLWHQYHVIDGRHTVFVAVQMARKSTIESTRRSDEKAVHSMQLAVSFDTFCVFGRIMYVVITRFKAVYCHYRIHGNGDRLVTHCRQFPI